MLPGFLRSARSAAMALLVLAVAGGVIGFTWYAVARSTGTQQHDAIERTNSIVTALAANYAEQINRQILALDQTLETMAQEWEADPDHFSLATWHARSKVLAGISRDMFLTDENGIIRQSTVPEFVGQSAGDLEVFRGARERARGHAGDRPGLLLSRASVNPIMRQWHIDAARILRHRDGSFSGIIDIDYRVSAMNDVFTAASPPGNGFAAVFGVTDGKLRAASGSAGGTPDTSIADTPLFAAIGAANAGLWVGPSASDAVVRFHAYRRVQGRDLAVVAGVDLREAFLPVALWQREARVFAVAITGLTGVASILALSLLGAGRRRAARAGESKALLAAADARAEVSRAHADAVSRRLQATFAAVTDGVAIFDAHLNLVEWNSLFPERSGVNASFIRVGMPMEAVLRAQAEGGYFGDAADVDADVERRAALLRAGNFGASQTFQAEGRVIELRCRPLTEGGFVALYTDVTENRQARHALREAREALAREQSSRMRFLGVISHELRARVALLMRSISGFRASQGPGGQITTGQNPAGQIAAGQIAAGQIAAGQLPTGTIQPEMLPNGQVPAGKIPSVNVPTDQVLAETVPSAAVAQLLDQVRRVGVMLANLAADAVEVPRMEAGALELRPALLGVRTLLRDCIDKIQPAARDLGITAYLIVNDSAPEELIADPDRLRQIVNLLLAEAVRFAAPDTMWLLADGGVDERGDKIALQLTIRSFGTPISEAAQSDAFPPLDAVTVPDPSALEAGDSGLPPLGTGLGPAIAHHLTTLTGGQLRCDGWSTVDGRTGNDFSLTLPAELLPGQRGRAPGQIPPGGRPLPRTRLLLAGAPTGLRIAAVTMLRRDGHMVTSVATGEEVVQSLRLVPYDIVFLDTVLPDMNVEATMGVIREMAGPGRTVPVIALAAPHDEIEDRAWRDAGVDDILINNPTLEVFAGAISRHVWLNRSLGPVAGPMPDIEDETEDGMPILAAERIAELRANIQPEHLLDMAEECIADLFHRLPALRRALGAGATGPIIAQAHAMVGMAGGYGMAVLEARLRAVLSAARAQRLDTIDGAAAVIEADLTRTAAILRRTLRPARTDMPM